MFVVSLLCMYLFLLGMSKVETPPLTPVRSKKCGSCHSILTDLDPHSGCNKRGIQLRGGTILGRYAQMFLQPPKPNLPVGSRPWEMGFRPQDGNYLHVRESHGMPHGIPDPKAGGSRHCDGGAHGGEICPSQELEDPLASQQPFTGLLGPSALPLVGGAPGCDLSDPSHVMESRGTTSHTATAMAVSGASALLISLLTAQQGAVLRSSYGSDGMGEVFTGTASTAFTGQRSQPWTPRGSLS